MEFFVKQASPWLQNIIYVTDILIVGLSFIFAPFLYFLIKLVPQIGFSKALYNLTYFSLKKIDYE